MGGFSNAPRCPASLTFRDSPALVRQESDGYPVRPVASYSIADRPFPPPRSPLECSGSRQAARRWASAPHAPALPPLTHTQARHAHTRQTRRPALKRKEKWEGGDQRGRLPAYATPQRGAAIAEAVPKHNSQTRSGPGGLGGCLPDRRCTGLSARRWMGRCPCLPSIRQSGTYAAPGKGRARSSTEPRAPNDPGGE